MELLPVNKLSANVYPPLLDLVKAGPVEISQRRRKFRKSLGVIFEMDEVSFASARVSSVPTFRAEFHLSLY